MPELQRRLVLVLREALSDGAAIVEESAPDWLTRPGRVECGELWPLVQRVYRELTGLELPEVMPPRERRRLDVVITRADGTQRAVEVDESQHFTAARLTTFDHYANVPVGFDVDQWRERCEQRAGREPGGGFARPRPPLFDGEGGRHRQRAFRDFLADALPPAHGWWPTIRISDIEAKLVLIASDAALALDTLVAERARLGRA